MATWQESDIIWGKKYINTFKSDYVVVERNQNM